MMKTLTTRTLAVASGLVFSGVSAFAQDLRPEQPFQSSKTRAEVRAELMQAIKDGTMPPVTEGAEYPRMAQSSQSTKTREEVRAELLQAIKDGTVITHNEWDFPKTAKAPPSTLTREAVRAETIEWLRLHRGDVMMGGY
jgi:uncharacterized protein with FMN-binding domain